MAALLTLTLVGLWAVDAQLQAPPAVVSAVALTGLSGEWFEVATTGSWWHRRCVAHTRYVFAAARGNRLQASSGCATPAGAARHRGQLRGASDGSGRLSIRFTPTLFNWLPATWSDFWILASGPAQAWVLVGDNRRERLLILSRTVALDESAVAEALAVARSQGYDVGRVVRVPHPAGVTGVSLP